jgi:beta-glucosidase/6-phospho-beta-glucosidase/beta-galactosidase
MSLRELSERALDLRGAVANWESAFHYARFSMAVIFKIYQGTVFYYVNILEPPRVLKYLYLKNGLFPTLKQQLSAHTWNQIVKHAEIVW